MKNSKITVILFGLLVTLNLVQLGIHAELSKSDWASWVQAFGSIAAIVGAIWISRIEGKRGRELRKEEAAEKRANQILLAVMHGNHARKILNELGPATETSAFNKALQDFHHARIGVVLRGLESIRFDELSLEAGRCIASYTIIITEIFAITSSESGIKTGPDVAKHFADLNAKMAEQMELLCKEYQAITGHYPLP